MSNRTHLRCFRIFIPNRVQTFFSSFYDRSRANDFQSSDTFNQTSSVELYDIDKPVINLQIERFTVQSCKDYAPVQEIIKTKDDSKVHIFLIYFERDSLEFLNEELQNLTDISGDLSIVLLIKSTKNSDLKLIWKSNEIEPFLVLKHYSESFTENDEKLYEFIAEFLADSLRRGHLGLSCEALAGLETPDVEIHYFADFRGLNLIHYAADVGNADIVKILLSLKCNTESTDKNINAQTLAWNKRHSDVLLVFAQASLPYPLGIDIQQLSIEFKIFYVLTEELHKAIKRKDERKVLEVLSKNEYKLKHFFNTSNESAAKIALDEGLIEIYEILIVHEVCLSPQEIANDVFENLEYEYKRVIREIHTKHSKDHPDNYINILMANSYSAHDGTNVEPNLDLVKDAYKQLSQDPFCDAVMRVVAASRKIDFYYDFKRDAVNAVDPTATSDTEGVFYEKGRIYIGASQILDKATEHQAIAVMAHEMCHCAMNLVYRNNAKPYYANDHKAMQKFEMISKKCEEYCHIEPLVDIIYTRYPKNVQHAELIVRVPHTTNQYRNEPEIMETNLAAFPELYDYAENTVLPDMINAVPEIKRRERLELSRKDEKILRLKRNLCISIILSILGGIGLALFLFFILDKPIYRFGELSESNRLKVWNGKVIYKTIDLKLDDLFPRNSTIYEKLSSEHITQIFAGKPLNFSDDHFWYLDRIVTHNWTSMHVKLKEKVLNSNMTFQNSTLKIRKMNEIAPKAFDSMTSNEISLVLNGENFTIGGKIENKTEFYVERKLTQRVTVLNLEDIYKTYGTSLAFTFQHEENIKTFYIENYAKNNSFNESDLVIKEEYPLLTISAGRNILDVLDQAIKSRFFILSDEAGTGKTFTFEQLAVQLKDIHQLKWVAYVDLKNHTKFYKKTEKLENLQNLLENILELSTEKEFEREIFRERFASNQVMFLWNGFDEISPDYNEFFISVMQDIYNNSGNIQFVCTRPLYAGQLEKTFNSTPYGLLPFTDKDQKEFLHKFFTSKKYHKYKVENFTEKAYQVSKQQNFKTPLMLKMIAEVHKKIESLEIKNLYSIYSVFVDKKVEVWQEKGEFAKKLTKSLLSGKVNVMTIYQKYAILSEFFLNTKVKELKIMKTKIPESLPYHEITRMGILYFNNETEFEFAHKTFAEFFVAQYFIENFYGLKEEDEFDENILDLFRLLQKNEMVSKFIIDYLDNQTETANTFNSKITSLLLTTHKNILMDMLFLGTSQAFEMFFKVFSRDKRVFIELLKVNEDETLYTAIFNPVHFAIEIDPDLIKSLGRNNLTGDEYSKFVTGKNQRGKILFGMALYEINLRISKSHDEYKVDTDNRTHEYILNFYDYAKDNLTKSEQKELLKLLIGNPRLYFLSPAFKHFHYENLLKHGSEIFTENEQKEVIAAALGTCDELFDYKYIEVYLDISNSLLAQANRSMSSAEIHKMFVEQKLLQKALIFRKIFDQFWDFFVSHTDEKQQKNALVITDSFGRIDSSAHNGGFYFSRDSTPFNIFGFSLFSRIQFGSFPSVAQLYKKYLSNTEIQNAASISNVYLVHMIANTDIETVKMAAEFLSEVFKGNEEKLLQFFDTKIGKTEFTIFKYFEGLKLDSDDQLEIFTNLTNELRNEIKE